MEPQFWRYFLGFVPDARLRARILMVIDALGIANERAIQSLHLTVCTIAETATRDEDIVRRLYPVLAAARLAACRIGLGKSRSGGKGAVIRSVGSQQEISRFYDQLRMALNGLGIAPLYRASGLRAHITLSYEGGDTQDLAVPFEWIPTELFLIESAVGCSRHEVVARWPLLPPVQGEFDWGEQDDGNFVHRLRQELAGRAA